MGQHLVHRLPRAHLPRDRPGENTSQWPTATAADRRQLSLHAHSVNIYGIYLSLHDKTATRPPADAASSGAARLAPASLFACFWCCPADDTNTLRASPVVTRCHPPQVTGWLLMQGLRQGLEARGLPNGGKSMDVLNGACSSVLLLLCVKPINAALP